MPEAWSGEWYMSFLPDDLLLINIYNDMLIAEYGNDLSTRQLWFSEMGQDDNMLVGTENTSIMAVRINNDKGWMVIDHSEDHALALLWEHEDKWFRISSFGIAEDELMSIAEGVKKIKIK